MPPCEFTDGISPFCWAAPPTEEPKRIERKTRCFSLEPGETLFKFWHSLATLVFENAFDTHVQVGSYENWLDIDEIVRGPTDEFRDSESVVRANSKWTIICLGG